MDSQEQIDRQVRTVSAYRDVFAQGNESGRLVLCDLVAWIGVFADESGTTDPVRMAVRTGQRSVISYIISMSKTDPEMFLEQELNEKDEGYT